MWLITAENPLICRGCAHSILEGHPCMSDRLERCSEPTDVHLGTFRYFHLDCQECQSGVSCYQQYASRQPNVDILKEVACSYCDHTIHAGHQAFHDRIVILASEDAEPQKATLEKTAQGFAGTGNMPINKSVRFDELSPDLILKLRRAGLGNGRGFRTHAEAEQLFVESIPASVRNSGEKVVWQFLKNKQASHIESVVNAPGKAKNPGNIKWESGKSNQMRGSRNMNGVEKASINAKNGAHTAGIVAKNAARSAGRGAIFAVLLEAPVSAIENGIHVSKGRKSKKDAVKDTAKDVGKAGIVGGITAGGIAVAGALGFGAILAPAAPVLAVAGVGVFTFSAIRRIGGAMKDDVEGDVAAQSIPLYFHAECDDCETSVSCYDAYVTDISNYLRDDDSEL